MFQQRLTSQEQCDESNCHLNQNQLHFVSAQDNDDADDDDSAVDEQSSVRPSSSDTYLSESEKLAIGFGAFAGICVVIALFWNTYRYYKNKQEYRAAQAAFKDS